MPHVYHVYQRHKRKNKKRTPDQGRGGARGDDQDASPSLSRRPAHIYIPVFAVYAPVYATCMPYMLHVCHICYIYTIKTRSIYDQGCGGARGDEQDAPPGLSRRVGHPAHIYIPHIHTYVHHKYVVYAVFIPVYAICLLVYAICQPYIP